MSLASRRRLASAAAFESEKEESFLCIPRRASENEAELMLLEWLPPEAAPDLCCNFEDFALVAELILIDLIKLKIVLNK